MPRSRRLWLTIPPLLLLAWWLWPRPSAPPPSALELSLAERTPPKPTATPLRAPPPPVGLTPVPQQPAAREPDSQADDLAPEGYARVWVYAPRSDGSTASLSDPDVLFTIGCDFEVSPREPDLLLIPAPVSCAFFASRNDGALMLRSPPVVLQLEPGQEHDLHLALPEGRAGGVGVSFRMTSTGARVMTVHPGSPAEAAGLAQGDLIVAVDGAPIEGWSQWDFVSRVAGLAGTDVHLTIAVPPEEAEAHGGHEVGVTFRRAPLEDPRW